MEWSQLPYQYEDLSPRQIRVVVLYPLTSDNDIHCELKRVFIDENPVYEALSYVWGDTIDKVPIRVGCGTLKVTQNLYSALRALVLHDTERTIWVDALCINQDDVSDKNHQVQFMKEVYARASRVVIWLGPAAEKSDMAMEYVGSLDAEPALKEFEELQGSYAHDWHWSTAEPWKALPVSYDAVDNLISRPWFSRIWVIQEAVVNRETIFVCGAKIVLWKQFFSLAWSIMKSYMASGRLIKRLPNSETGVVSIISIQCYRNASYNISLFDVLQNSLSAEATDPRDRIYAVQNLAKDPDETGLLLQPDYKETVSEIYTRMSINFYEAQNGQILGLVGRLRQSINALPSWVVDWTTTRIPYFVIGFSAHGISEASFEITTTSGIHRLTVRGIILSSISAVVDNLTITRWPGSPATHEELQFLRDYFAACIALIESGSIRGKINSNQKDLWRAIVGDNSDSSGVRYPKNYDGNLIRFPEWISSYSDQADLEISSLYVPFLDRIVRTGVDQSRQFAMDSLDDMCLVSDITRPGDLIMIVSGYCRPLVIRAVEEKLYEIIGACYVHGYMDGEAFEGHPDRPFEEFVFC